MTGFWTVALPHASNTATQISSAKVWSVSVNSSGENSMRMSLVGMASANSRACRAARTAISMVSAGVRLKTCVMCSGDVAT